MEHRRDRPHFGPFGRPKQRGLKAPPVARHQGRGFLPTSRQVSFVAPRGSARAECQPRCTVEWDRVQPLSQKPASPHRPFQRGGRGGVVSQKFRQGGISFHKPRNMRLIITESSCRKLAPSSRSERWVGDDSRQLDLLGTATHEGHRFGDHGHLSFVAVRRVAPRRPRAAGACVRPEECFASKPC